MLAQPCPVRTMKLRSSVRTQKQKGGVCVLSLLGVIAVAANDNVL